MMVPPPIGISEHAIVHETALIDESATISAGVVIGEDVVVGANTVVLQNVVILDGSTVGSRTTIFPNVVLYENTIVGDGCRMTAGDYGRCHGCEFCREAHRPVPAPGAPARASRQALLRPWVRRARTARCGLLLSLRRTCEGAAV